MKFRVVSFRKCWTNRIFIRHRIINSESTIIVISRLAADCADYRKWKYVFSSKYVARGRSLWLPLVTSARRGAWFALRCVSSERVKINIYTRRIYDTSRNPLTHFIKLACRSKSTIADFPVVDFYFSASLASSESVYKKMIGRKSGCDAGKGNYFCANSVAWYLGILTHFIKLVYWSKSVITRLPVVDFIFLTHQRRAWMCEYTRMIQLKRMHWRLDKSTNMT